MADILFPFRKGNVWGFRNDRGKRVIKPQFESAGSFSEGLARVKRNGKWGFIDLKGKMVIEPRFDQARFFQGGYAKVQEGVVWGYIDTAGFFVEKLDAGSFVDKTGEFISEQDYKRWGKRPRKE